LRDQIKTWLTSNDIKDKTPLMDNRKLIETVSYYNAAIGNGHYHAFSLLFCAGFLDVASVIYCWFNWPTL